MSRIHMTAPCFSDRFAALTAGYPGLTVGRILSQEKGLYRVMCERGGYLAEISGKFRYEAQNVSDFPAVGNFVMHDRRENSGHAIIHHVLTRKSMFIRKAAGTSHKEQVVATNIDT